MKRKLLLGLIGNALCLSAIGQTITAPTGQPLNITNNVEVAGNVNIPVDSSLKIGGFKMVSAKGTNNLFLGRESGLINVAGAQNTFIGTNAGRSNTGGSNNFFMGFGSGFSNTNAGNNFFLGIGSGYANTSGANNTFLGNNTGGGQTSGGSNIMIGYFAGAVANADRNILIGVGAGVATSSGQENVFLGTQAGLFNTTGSQNTYIGQYAQGTATISNATAIGANSSVSTSNTLVLGNGATTVTGTGIPNSSGLRFPNLTSGTMPRAVVGGTGVLSVDGSGNVVLVSLVGGATISSTDKPVAENTWKEQDGYLYNNSTNGVVINGTGLDGNSLIVKGGVLSKEVNVKVEGSESWPDYVFKPSYKRMTLDEVEKFININGHLPNVASATEMAATGNNLNKTDIKLLEKVEELTLYLLEMKKANEVQNAEIQNLKKQVKSLRKK